MIQSLYMLLHIFGFPHKNEKIKIIYEKIFRRNPRNNKSEKMMLECRKINKNCTTRKPINTNRNTEGIFPSVNFRGILPTDIFPRYLRRDKKNFKKNDDVSGFTNGITSIGNIRW